MVKAVVFSSSLELASFELRLLHSTNQNSAAAPFTHRRWTRQRPQTGFNCDFGGPASSRRKKAFLFFQWRGQSLEPEILDDGLNLTAAERGRHFDSRGYRSEGHERGREKDH